VDILLAIGELFIIVIAITLARIRYYEQLYCHRTNNDRESVGRRGDKSNHIRLNKTKDGTYRNVVHNFRHAFDMIRHSEATRHSPPYA
jgi:hypothetical protein